MPDKNLRSPAHTAVKNGRIHAPLPNESLPYLVEIFNIHSPHSSLVAYSINGTAMFIFVFFLLSWQIEATPSICQSLISTALKAGGEHVMRIPALLRVMGDANLRPEMSLLEVLRMLFEADG